MVFVFEKRLEIFFPFRLAEDASRPIVSQGSDRGDERLEIFAKVGRFAVSDIFCPGNRAIVRLARCEVAAVFTDMEIGVAMEADSAKPDLNGDLAHSLSAFPARRLWFHAYLPTWLILLSSRGIIHIDIDEERFAICIPSAVLADDDRIVQVPVLKRGDIARRDFPSDRFP